MFVLKSVHQFQSYLFLHGWPWRQTSFVTFFFHKQDHVLLKRLLVRLHPSIDQWQFVKSHKGFHGCLFRRWEFVLLGLNYFVFYIFDFSLLLSILFTSDVSEGFLIGPTLKAYHAFGCFKHMLDPWRLVHLITSSGKLIKLSHHPLIQQLLNMQKLSHIFQPLLLDSLLLIIGRKLLHLHLIPTLEIISIVGQIIVFIFQIFNFLNDLGPRSLHSIGFNL